jgi:hypothetical protein
MNTPQVEAKNLISQREFLKKLGLALGLATLPSSLRAAEDSSTNVNTNNTTTSPSQDSPTNAIDLEQENNKISDLNLNSAHAVTAGFLMTIGHSLLKNHGHMSLQHAGIVNGLESTRLALLLTGNQNDKDFAHNEIHELLVNTIPAVLLVVATDFASTSIALEPANIFKRVIDSLLNIDWRNLVNTRPDLSEMNIQPWQQHLELASNSLAQRVSQIVAVTSVAAPFTTTLSSAALFRDEIDDVAHLCIEIFLAQEIIQCIKEGFNPKEKYTELRATAANKATEYINGPWGYNQLGVALACNAQGLCGIGTPPNLWFAYRHLVEHTKGWLKSEAYGATLAEAHTLTLTAHWLSNVTGQTFVQTTRSVLDSSI